MKNLRNNLPLLYDFYIVASYKSYSKAAQNNYVSQSNLSRSVKTLEEELNLKLINRNNKGLNLTKDGIHLYNELDKVFSTFSLNNDTITGVLAIGTTRNIADNKLIEYISLFNKKYPNVKIKIFTDSLTNLNEFFTSHKIDILIDYLPHDNYSDNNDIKKVQIDEFKTCFACSKTFKDKDKIKSLKDLQNYNLVMPGNSRRKIFLDEILQKSNVELIPLVEMPDSKLMADFVINNDYIGYFIEEEVENYNLYKLNIKEELPINHIGMIYYKNQINSLTKMFIDLVSDNNE